MVHIPGLKEIYTVMRVHEGKSLARFGDGELMILRGDDSRTQKATPELQRELMDVAYGSPCIVGYPHARGKRSAYWEKFLEVHGFWDGEKPSSFVSRIDEVPELDDPGYRDLIRAIWKGRNVTLVGSGTSLRRGHMTGAKSVISIEVPDQNAYSQINDIEAQIGTPELTILCAGPTATCLADRLTRKGLRAVDLGYTGKFM